MPSDANKTQPTLASVEGFLATVDDDAKRADASVLAALMAEVTGLQGRMWGSSIVGFGTYHYRYASGREGDFFQTGFSPRKRALTVYVMPGFAEHQALLARLGKHTTGKSCLHIRRLADVDIDVLREIIVRSVRHIRTKHPVAD